MAAAAAESRPFRCERKFLVEDLEAHEVESVVRLHPALFREIYPPRWVNNIYLDTFDARSYTDNVDGLRDRVKVRVRWYGELFGPIGEPVLELKIKRGLLGRKEVYRLAGFALEPGFDLQVLDTALAGPGLPEGVREHLKGLLPFLLNRYRRRYFLSADGRIRLTLDGEREFYSVKARNNTFCARHRNATTTILELKHAPEWAERAAEIATRLPVRMTKSSKYVQGLDLLTAW